MRGDLSERVSRRRIVVTALAAVVVLAVAGVVTLILTRTDEHTSAGPATPTSTEHPASAPSATPVARASAPPPPADDNIAAARTVAEHAATAISDRDVAAMRRLSCDPANVGGAEEFPPQASAHLAENPEITGDKATAQLELTIAGSPPTTVPLPMAKRHDTWCVL